MSQQEEDAAEVERMRACGHTAATLMTNKQRAYSDHFSGLVIRDHDHITRLTGAWLEGWKEGGGA